MALWGSKKGRRWALVGLVLAAAGVVAALPGRHLPPSVGADARAPADVPPGAVVVELAALRFNPAEVRVSAGTTVVFWNRDEVYHNVLQSDAPVVGMGMPAFQSPQLAPGQSWAYTFREPGVYPVVCSTGGHFASGMVGAVIVEPAVPPPPA